ncbi:MAG: hypothetical protein FWE64_02625 [Alphaproteobacteria bacterium]|nr:hypothetical protein [Alphaproteobacteria bacterium]
MKSIVPYNINKSLIDPMKKIGADLKGKFTKAAKTPKAPKWTTPAWGKRAAVATIIIVFLLLPSLTGCGKAGNTTGPNPPIVKQNVTIPFTMWDVGNLANLQQLTDKVIFEVSKATTDTLFLEAQNDWDEFIWGAGGVAIMVERLEGVKELKPGEIWGKGVFNPPEILVSQKLRMEVMGYIVNAGKVIPMFLILGQVI